MACLSIHKYFAVFLLFIGVHCVHADDNEYSAEDMETFASRNQLLYSMFTKSNALDEYVKQKSDEFCQKILDVDIYKNVTSAVLESRDKVLSNCIHHVVDRIVPTKRRRGDGLDENILLKHGFEDFRKVMDQKYEEFYEEIVREIDLFVKSLSPEQQSKAIAANLTRWSSKIKDAPNLAKKEMAYITWLGYYYFERGV